MSTCPARSYKAAAEILSERDPVLRRLVAEAGSSPDEPANGDPLRGSGPRREVQ
jgi:hypothetical protein